jgi:hypothetical protein
MPYIVIVTSHTLRTSRCPRNSRGRSPRVPSLVLAAFAMGQALAAALFFTSRSLY